MFRRAVWNKPPACPISKFSKITRMIYPKNCPNQTSDYWLITPNQQRLCIQGNIFKQWAKTSQRVGNYKTAGDCNQFRLQSIVELLQ